MSVSNITISVGHGHGHGHSHPSLIGESLRLTYGFRFLSHFCCFAQIFVAEWLTSSYMLCVPVNKIVPKKVGPTVVRFGSPLWQKKINHCSGILF